MRARRDGERTRCRERGARVEERHPRHGPALRGGGNRVDPAPTAGDAPTLGGRPGRRPRGEAAASTPRSRPASDRGAARQPPRRSQEARPGDGGPGEGARRRGAARGGPGAFGLGAAQEGPESRAPRRGLRWTPARAAGSLAPGQRWRPRPLQPRDRSSCWRWRDTPRPGDRGLGDAPQDPLCWRVVRLAARRGASACLPAHRPRCANRGLPGGAATAPPRAAAPGSPRGTQPSRAAHRAHPSIPLARPRPSRCRPGGPLGGRPGCGRDAGHLAQSTCPAAEVSWGHGRGPLPEAGPCAPPRRLRATCGDMERAAQPQPVTLAMLHSFT